METSLLELQSVDPDEAAPNVGGVNASRPVLSITGWSRGLRTGLSRRLCAPGHPAREQGVLRRLLVCVHGGRTEERAFLYTRSQPDCRTSPLDIADPRCGQPGRGLQSGGDGHASHHGLSRCGRRPLCGPTGPLDSGSVGGTHCRRLAAVYPNMWMPSGILMSETPAMLVTALILLAIVRIYRSPTLGNAALLGVLCGAGALVRAELILFVPCLLLPAVLAARKLSARRRLKLLGIGLLATGIVLAPWVGRNLATFQDATYLTTSDGGVLLGANCPATYGHWALGYWYPCPQSLVDSGSGDESVISARYASRA